MLDTVCKEYSVIIKIVPLWYHTVWAYVGIFLLFLACLVGYVYKLYRKGFLVMWQEPGLYHVRDWKSKTKENFQ